MRRSKKIACGAAGLLLLTGCAAPSGETVDPLTNIYAINADGSTATIETEGPDLYRDTLIRCIGQTTVVQETIDNRIFELTGPNICDDQIIEIPELAGGKDVPSEELGELTNTYTFTDDGSTVTIKTEGRDLYRTVLIRCLGQNTVVQENVGNHVFQSTSTVCKDGTITKYDIVKPM